VDTGATHTMTRTVPRGFWGADGTVVDTVRTVP